MARGTWGGALDPNIYKVSIRWQQGSGLCQTGFKVRDKLVQDNTPETVATTVWTWVNASFRTMLMNADTLLGVDALKLGTDEGFTYTPVNVHGTMNPDQSVWEPGFLCANIALKAQLRKRYGQGRMFWPLRNGDWTTQETLNAVGIAAYQGVIDALVAAFGAANVGNDLGMVNAHGVLPPRAATGSRPARPEIPASWYDVDTVRLTSVVTGLKSRRAGIGA